MERFKRITISFMITLIGLLCTIQLINMYNENEIINVYLSRNHQSIDEVGRIKVANNRVLLVDNDGATVGLLVYQGLIKTYNIQGIEKNRISSSYGKELSGMKLDHVELKYTDNNILGEGQYSGLTKDSWVPECSIACIKSILKTDGVDTVVTSKSDGLDLKEIISILDELGYSANVTFNIEDINGALSRGNYILAGYECNGIGHAVLITNKINLKNKTYYEIMNPMGLEEDERYSLIESNLKLNIDTRCYKDTAMYNFMYGIIIHK